VGLALPAPAAQGGRDHGRAFAGTLGDLHGAEPVGLRRIDGEVEVIAALILAHLIVLVVGRSVEFHADAVVGVPVVLVMSLAADGPPCLALRLGQSMCTFDVARYRRSSGKYAPSSASASASLSQTRQRILLRPPIASRNMPTETRCLDRAREIQL
jgi:uncharacterized membrane protein YoaK (UPF0700 family)